MFQLFARQPSIVEIVKNLPQQEIKARSIVRPSVGMYDPEFREHYTKSEHTDVAKTFERARARIAETQ